MPRYFPNETLGQRIARLRSKRGWTQQQLADRIAASRVAVSHFEMGIAVPSERTIVLLAGLFRLEPHELVDSTQYPEAKADRLPVTAPRYTETELQIALLERDLAWAERVGGATQAVVVSEWQPRLAALLAATSYSEERNLIETALQRLRLQP